MRLRYICVNDQIVVDNELLFGVENRGLRYGDGVFETMLWLDGGIRFLDHHIERLQNSMQQLRFANYKRFDKAFVLEKTYTLILKNGFNLQGMCRVRLQVFRDGGGLYSPVNNDAAYFLEVDQLEEESKDKKSGLIVGLYDQHYKAASSLSHLKSSNALIFVLAGLYRKEKGLDEVVILNQDGLICETLSSNIFVSYQNTLYTPALSEGCVAGVMRRVVMHLAEELEIPVVEARVDAALLEAAEEIFLTNAIKGVQWVMGYKKKRYFTKLGKQFQSQILANLS